MTVRALAWDLDGTLAESEVLAMPAAVNEAADLVEQTRRIPIPNSTRQAFIMSLMGKTINEIGDAIGDSYGMAMPEDFKARVMCATIKLLAERCEAVYGAIDVVKNLSAQGFQQWIATSSAPERVLPTLQRSGLIQIFQQQEFDWFSAKITKPDPEVYARSCKIRGFAPAEVGAVEDSPTGVEAAVANGHKLIIGFTGGSHIPADKKTTHAQKLIAAGVSVVVGSLGGIPDAIGQHNARISARPLGTNPRPQSNAL